MNWRVDKARSDRFLPAIKRAICEVLICPAPQEEDAERNTDLIVLRMNAQRIACRVREPGFFESYGHEFTIREGRPSGAKTELTKIVEGWGDLFFYGHAQDEGPDLRAWALCDLSVFRGWFVRELARLPARELPGVQRRNRDNSSTFRVFDIRQMPAGFVLDSQGLPPAVSVAPGGPELAPLDAYEAGI